MTTTSLQQEETLAATPNQTLEDLPELSFQFDRVEASFSAITSLHKKTHRRLALSWAAKIHAIPLSTFQKAFQLWLESIEGGLALW